MPQKIAEQAVIGAAVMIDGQWPIQALELEPEDFSLHDHARIWGAMIDVRKRDEPVDIATVYAEIKREHGSELGIEMMRLAEACPTVANMDHWAGMVINASRRRGAASAVQGALARMEGNPSADDAIEAIGDAMRQVRPPISDTGPKLMKASMMGVLDDLEKERLDPNHARLVSSGIETLDEAFEMRAEHLTILAARPGVGKSSLAGNIAAHAALDDNGGGVALFSLEMDTASLIRRVMSSEARLRTGLPQAIGSDQLTNACHRIMRMRLYVDDRPGLSIDQMSAALPKIPELRLVVVDYLQLARMNAKIERQDLRVGAVTKQLKNMAKTHHCHVMALSQLNRAVESRTPPRPMMSDLRDSGQIEEDADNVIFIYREGYHDPDKDQERTELVIDKQRHGRRGTVLVRWIPSAQRFVSW